MKELTTAFGAPVDDNQNVKTAGERGPTLFENAWFIEKMAHFDREVIPERRTHAKGAGAFGTFTTNHKRGDANTYYIHPFDLTKVWPHADYPLIEVGIMELNKNPENVFADVEQLPMLLQTLSRDSATCPIRGEGTL